MIRAQQTLGQFSAHCSSSICWSFPHPCKLEGLEKSPPWEPEDAGGVLGAPRGALSGLEHRCPAQSGQADSACVSQPSPHAAQEAVTAATQSFISLPLKRGNCLVTGETSAHRGYEKKINQLSWVMELPGGLHLHPPFPLSCMRFELLMSRSDLQLLPNLPSLPAAPGNPCRSR